MKKYFSLFLLLQIPFFVHAQTKAEEVPGDWYLPKKASEIEGTVNCFDYYHFGSVQVDVSPIQMDMSAGETAVFKGKLKNTNVYPVVNGQVYVKIFKKSQLDDSLLQQNGYPVIDFFLAKDNISIAANTEKEISFNWVVPKNANGEYQAVYYFTSAHRYNLLGLSFTDDVVGNKADFRIKGRQDIVLPVEIDKNSIILNDNPFHPVGFLPHFTKDELTKAQVTLSNKEDKEKTVQVIWTTSRWDGILSSNEVKTETMNVVLKPKETRKISYSIPTLQTSVTFVKSEVKDGDSKSIIFIRFIRDGYKDTRINFPSILKYPLSKKEENTIFSCAHATNESIVSGNKLTLTLEDLKGKIVHSYVYSGSITGNMMGVKDSFVPKKNLSNFLLRAKLEQGGKVTEEVVMKYDCNELDKSVCEDNRILYVVVIILGVVVAFASYFFGRKRKNDTSEISGEIINLKDDNQNQK